MRKIAPTSSPAFQTELDMKSELVVRQKTAVRKVGAWK